MKLDRIAHLTAGFTAIKDKLAAYVRSIFDLQYATVTVGTQPNPEVIAALEDRVIILCDKSQEKLTGDLKFQLLDGYKNSESVDQISQRVKAVFSGTDFEIERIVRTEILNASNAGRFEGNRDMGAKWKVWKAAMNNARTADDSKRLNNQVRAIDDPFIDPENDKAHQYPPNRPMCRCSVDYYVEKPETVSKHGMEYLE